MQDVLVSVVVVVVSYENLNIRKFTCLLFNHIKTFFQCFSYRVSSLRILVSVSFLSIFSSLKSCFFRFLFFFFFFSRFVSLSTLPFFSSPSCFSASLPPQNLVSFAPFTSQFHYTFEDSPTSLLVGFSLPINFLSLSMSQTNWEADKM